MIVSDQKLNWFPVTSLWPEKEFHALLFFIICAPLQEYELHEGGGVLVGLTPVPLDLEQCPHTVGAWHALVK